MNRVPGIGFMDMNMNGNAIFLMRGFPKYIMEGLITEWEKQWANITNS